MKVHGGNLDVHSDTIVRGDLQIAPGVDAAAAGAQLVQPSLTIGGNLVVQGTLDISPFHAPNGLTREQNGDFGVSDSMFFAKGPRISIHGSVYLGKRPSPTTMYFLRMVVTGKIFVAGGVGWIGWLHDKNGVIQEDQTRQ